MAGARTAGARATGTRAVGARTAGALAAGVPVARARAAGARRAGAGGARQGAASARAGRWARGLATGCALGALGLFSIRFESVLFLSRFLDIVREPGSCTLFITNFSKKKIYLFKFN